MGVGRDARQPRRRESPVEVGTELANDVHTQQPKLLSCTRGGGGGGGDGLGWWLAAALGAPQECTVLLLLVLWLKGMPQFLFHFFSSLHRSDANHWKMHPADLRPAWLSPGSSSFSGGGRRQSCSTKYALCSYAVVVVVKALSCKTKKTNLPQGCWWFRAQYSAL